MNTNAMRYVHLLFLLVFTSASLVSAQQGPLDPAQQKQFDDAVKRGDRAFAGGGLDIDQAMVAYEQALSIAPNDASVSMKLGLCRLNGSQRHLALPHFEKAVADDPKLPRIHFLLGYAYQLNGQWDEAIAAYSEHKRLTQGIPDQESIYNMADKHLAECRNGKSLSEPAADVQVENMGAPINSDQADYGALVSADGSRLLFTSRRMGTTGGKVSKMTNEYYEDIYVCTLTNTGWSEPTNAGAPLNSNGNDATMGLFDNGSMLFIYRDGSNMGDILQSERTGEVWSNPKPLQGSVNSKYQESSAWLTADKQWLYFVSDRPEEGLGGQDIYRARWNSVENMWGTAENLGPDVNTPFDEEGVFISADGSTLYFGSKGHTSMGGYDIFRTQLVDGMWSKPENMGMPINSPDDDVFFALTDDGRTGYFCSVRPGGHGMDDLYKVTFGTPQEIGQAR